MNSPTPLYDQLVREFAGREARQIVRDGLAAPKRTRRSPRLTSPTRLAILNESVMHYAVSAS